MHISMTRCGPATSREMIGWVLVNVTLLADAMRKHHQVVGVAAVHIMARQTAVATRRRRDVVVVDEGTLFVGVTCETERVAISNELRIIHTSMDRVAVLATDLAFFYRMVRPHVKLGKLVGMTRITKLEFVLLYKEIIKF